MGFFDNLKEALGADHHDQPSMAESTVPRHVNRDVPVESVEDAAAITGGKHALRD